MNINVPDKLYNEIKEKADEMGISTINLIKTFFKLGLIALEIEQSPDSSLIVREDGVDKELTIFG